MQAPWPTCSTRQRDDAEEAAIFAMRAPREWPFHTRPALLTARLPSPGRLLLRDKKKGRETALSV